MDVKRATENNAEKEALLLLLLEDAGIAVPRVQNITPRQKSDSYPLSFAQQRLWFLNQLEPDSSQYNLPLRLHLEGELRVGLLEKSLVEIVRRHEALRTCFPVVDNQPVQVVSAPQALPLALTDLSHLADAASMVETIAQDEAQQRFDLAAGPLFRARLLRLAAAEHVLLLNMHHIVSDGWSSSIFIRELSALYHAYTNGLPSPLAELPIQYADYAVWQREWLQGAMLQEQLQYWREQLQGAPPVLELPTDHPRPAVQSFRGARHAALLDHGVSEQLQELSRREGVTLFMSLLAAWQVLLARYSGQEEIVVGSPIAGRTRSETEGLIGCFVNTLVLRSDLSGDPSFAELLQRVKEVCLGAYGHQELPFEKLVEELQPERSLSHNPLFQVMFLLHNAATELRDMGELRLQAHSVESTTAKFDLSLAVAETREGFKCSLQYSTDLFDPLTITRMLGHFETMLRGIVAAPRQRLSQLPLLTAAEQQRLLVEWNDTARPLPENKCIHQLFEKQVRLTPDAVAVSDEKKQLSYAELNGRANQLAHYLREQGVRADVLVGICLERSVEMVVSLLAVLKAGGAYVPLDPTYPEQRLSYMLQDAGVRVLLSGRTWRERVAVREGVQVLCREDWSAELASRSAANPGVELSATNLAYVIYTSGSTGVPKGVQIQHRSLSNFLHSLKTDLQITNADTLLAVTSLSFDIAGLELFLPLLVGAEIVLATTDMASNGALLIDKIESSDITIMQATPATWRLLVEAGWQSSKPLKKLCGGEALQPQLATELLDLPGSLCNLYGPTETTIWSALYRVSHDDSSDALIPIGNPIANTQIYVLDKKLNPVGIGIPGELYIGGEGLARGYVNLPGPTAERFIPNPFSDGPGERLYRTGDLVRHLPSGCIEFLGRMDHQVKVRGFRIELSEIECVLSSHPSVRACAVIAREDSPGDARLTAYTAAIPGTVVTSGELRKYLGQKLPAYMVPSAFVTLDELPLTPNGKLDRKALPAPDGESWNSPRVFVAPSTPLEQTVAAIWSQVLRVERVGLYDNFFEIGGHSLLATQVISRLREALQVELSLRVLFEHPTVASLVTLVIDRQCASGTSTSSPIPRMKFDLDRLLGELDQLSEDEVNLLMADEMQSAEG
jgi:amino acid adenylation domain-containing protein